MGRIELELPTAAPFDPAALFAFLAARAVPGLEAWDGTAYHRALDLPHGHGVAVVRAGDAESRLRATVRLEDRRDLRVAEQCLRRMFDLDADPVAVDATLAGDELLAPVVAAAPGIRVPGSVDPFETAVRAVIGQQISIGGARTVAGRIATVAGDRLRVDGGAVTHVFPSPAALSTIDPGLLPMPRTRQRTIRELAARVADGRIVFPGIDGDRSAMVTALLTVPGIGPWTAGYVAMRGLGDPDVFLPTDLGVMQGLAVLGVGVERAARWRPWRSYALHHLWRLAASARQRPK